MSADMNDLNRNLFELLQETKRTNDLLRMLITTIDPNKQPPIAPQR